MALSPSKLMTVINKSFFSIGTFGEEDSSTNISIDDIINQYIDEFNLTHISAIFHKASKNNLQVNFIKLCERLNCLIDSDACKPNCQNISNIVYGIRNFKNANAGELSLLLLTIIRVCDRCIDHKPTSQNFGNSLLGIF